MRSRPPRLVWLYVAFGTAVVCFGASTGLSHVRMAELDRAATQIAETASPSIEHLAEARGQLQVAALELNEYAELALASPKGSVKPDNVVSAREAVDRSIAEYLKLPVFPGERILWENVRRDLTHVDDQIQDVFSAVDARDSRAVDAELREMREAVDVASGSMLRSIDLSARHVHDLALEIGTIRAEATRTAFWLDVLSAVFTLVAVILFSRVLRRHFDLVDAHSRLVDARVDELEQFAGRVAHDVLSPLGTVSVALGMVDVGDPEKRARALARGQASLQRVQRIVDGLLEFARAGARPEPDACSDVREVLDDLGSELQPAAAEARIELTIEPAPRVLLSCSPGVLTSLISNLARNAIKYIGDAPRRSVVVRTFERGEMLRVEVEDTGGGLPPGMENAVFEPYVRVRGTGQAGIGLGLATVKRITQAHGGSVGVRSEVGKGCLFWFELPKWVPHPAC